MSASDFGELNVEQRDALSELRSRVQDLLSPERIQDDRYLARWLIARDFDVDKAYSMLRKSLEWRAKIGADELVESYKPPEVLTKYYAGGVCGFDRDGSPVWIDPMPLTDFRGILASATRTDVVKYKVRSVELMLALLRRQSEQLGKRIDQVCIVFDVNGLGWRHLWKPAVDTFVQVVQIFEDNYPEMLKRTYIINAPKLFVVAYGMLKPVLSDRTTSKVLVLGKNWRDVLLRDIPADELPAAYGGTMVDEDGDPRCPSKVNYGGEVPLAYYLKSKDGSNGDIPNDGAGSDGNAPAMLVASIDRSSSFQQSHHIVIAGCTLRCQFKTESHDIGIGVYYRPEHESSPGLAPEDDGAKQPPQRKQPRSHAGRWKVDEMEPVVPCERVSCSAAAHCIDVACDRVGMYVIHLDNTYSWTRGKKVHYSVEVLRPAREESDASLLDEMSAADL